MANYNDRIQTTYVLTIPADTMKADLRYNDNFTKNGKPKLNIPLGEENGVPAYLSIFGKDARNFRDALNAKDNIGGIKFQIVGERNPWTDAYGRKTIYYNTSYARMKAEAAPAGKAVAENAPKAEADKGLTASAKKA